MRFCSLAAFAVFAAALFAAPPEPTAAGGVKTVVRADPHTGKLVRVVVSRTVAPAPGAQAAFSGTVERIAAQQSLPPELLHSVIQVESAYNPAAVSPKGARGLMQLMPETARRFGVPDSFDPEENIQGGAKYLKYLLALYQGNYPLALAAYNAGEKAVAKYNGIPPYAETQTYVQRVSRKLAAAKPPAKPQPAAPAAAPPDPNAPRHLVEVVAEDGASHYVTR